LFVLDSHREGQWGTRGTQLGSTGVSKIFEASSAADMTLDEGSPQAIGSSSKLNQLEASLGSLQMNDEGLEQGRPSCP